MNRLKYHLLYSGRGYLLALVALMILGFGFSVWQRLGQIDDRVAAALDQNMMDLARALNTHDLLRTKRILWRVREPQVVRMELHLSNVDNPMFQQISIGQIATARWQTVQHTLPIWANGAHFGDLIYDKDWIAASIYSGRQNILLLSLFIAIMLVLFLSVTLRPINILRDIEQILSALPEIAEKARGEDAERIALDASVQKLRSPGLEQAYLAIIQKLFETMKRVAAAENELQLAETLSKLSSQVAHDIRSPLTALKVVSEHLGELPEEKRVMIRNAVQRIDDIANDLARKKSADTAAALAPQYPQQDTLSVQLLSSLVEPLISEKRIQCRARLGIQIQSVFDADSYGVFAKVQPVEFKRVLSNLINNAVEAMPSDGEVTLSITQSSDEVRVAVADNGQGISAELLPKLTQRGATFGKEQGSGLGLYHARTSIEQWDGTFDLQSSVGQGTTVVLTLPRAEAPAWFVPELILSPQQTVVIVDDDVSIHHVWDERFESRLLEQHDIHVQHFSSGTEAAQWYQSQPPNQPLFLCDYELLGEQTTGLDLIEQLAINDRAILVTSRYEEPVVQERCAKLGVRLIPKGLAGYVPIQIMKHHPQSISEPSTTDMQQGSISASTDSEEHANKESNIPCDCVLIDDDPMIHEVWKLLAKTTGKTVQAFANAEVFFAVAQQIHKHTPIYVDSNLGDGVKGEVVTKTIHELGFENIYLATGYRAEQFGELPWVKGIIGKGPPWLS